MTKAHPLGKTPFNNQRQAILKAMTRAKRRLHREIFQTRAQDWAIDWTTGEETYTDESIRHAVEHYRQVCERIVFIRDGYPWGVFF